VCRAFKYLRSRPAEAVRQDGLLHRPMFRRADSSLFSGRRSWYRIDP
jgi:hypothetical protein